MSAEHNISTAENGRSGLGGAATPAPAAVRGPSESPPETADRTARLERLVQEIHGKVDADARDRVHRPFSLAWLIGTLIQVLAVGLMVLALLDWVFQPPKADIQVLIKLGFAIALQLITLTAFVIAREDR